MKFFTAGDVINEITTADPTNPVTIDLDTTIHEALELMFKHDFSLLPVEENGTIQGVISYISICRVLKTVNSRNVGDLAAGNAVEDPVFVSTGKDLYDLFETFAADQYVLVGEPSDLEGVMTRYDVFYFLKGQVEPFLLIGDIEQNLHDLFENTYPNIEEQIDKTFSDRAENDPSYEIPRFQEFNFWDYQYFLTKNWGDFSKHFRDDRGHVDELLSDVRNIRNSIFHFRKGPHRVDRDKLRLAHRVILSANSD